MTRTSRDGRLPGAGLAGEEDGAPGDGALLDDLEHDAGRAPRLDLAHHALGGEARLEHVVQAEPADVGVRTCRGRVSREVWGGGSSGPMRSMRVASRTSVVPRPAVELLVAIAMLGWGLREWEGWRRGGGDGVRGTDGWKSGVARSASSHEGPQTPPNRGRPLLRHRAARHRRRATDFAMSADRTLAVVNAVIAAVGAPVLPPDGVATSAAVEGVLRTLLAVMDDAANAGLQSTHAPSVLKCSDVWDTAPLIACADERMGNQCKSLLGTAGGVQALLQHATPWAFLRVHLASHVSYQVVHALLDALLAFLSDLRPVLERHRRSGGASAAPFLLKCTYARVRSADPTAR